MSSISAVLIVLNEEEKIGPCLESLSWADEIVVVDGGSKDRTVEIASRHAKVYQRNFDSFSNQKNYGIEKAKGEWIFSIDADEKVTPELQNSLKAASREKTGFDGYHVKRTTFIFGKRFRFGGLGSEKILRFFRKGKGKFEQPVHEKVVVHGRVGELSGELLHHGSSTVGDYLKKLSLYTTLESQWMAEQKMRAGAADLYLKPLVRFLYSYVFRLGFLDGYEGFLFHTLSAWNYFLKYARLGELQKCL